MRLWITWKDGVRMVATRNPDCSFEYVREATDEDIDEMYSGRISYDRATDPTIESWNKLAQTSG